MKPFIDGYLIEINQYPRFGECLDLYTIKDYFYYRSDTKEYGHRDPLVPASFVINKEELPDEITMRDIINNKIPVMKRVIDLNKQKESWIFETNIKETKND